MTGHGADPAIGVPAGDMARDTTSNGARDTVQECLSEGTAVLAAANVPQARRETRLLLAHVLQRPVADLVAHPEAPVAAGQAWRDALARRARREPLSHITGTREFYGLTFEVGPEVLDPRPDSETLISAALEAVGNRPAVALDLGTGSGCLLLSLLAMRPAATGIGIDIDPRAVRLAARNARNLDLCERTRFAVSDWGAAVVGRFNLVFLNPPYVRCGEIDGLEPEVARFEPRSALDGGEDGLDAYRAASRHLPALLAADGRAVIECGARCTDDVAGILGTVGLVVQEVRRDLAGHRRCLVVALS